MLPNRENRRCPDDLSVMDLVQPDNAEPDRLLLVCTVCGRWKVLAGATEPDTGRHCWRDEATFFGRAPYIAGVGQVNLDG